MRRVVASVLFVSVVAVGCGGGDDPFTADIKMICGAGGGHDELPPEMRALAAMREIVEKIKTPEAARLMRAVIEAAPADKAALMAPAMAKAKLSRCALLER